ncbi:uncharacterized protein LOC124361070 [Homalodisca vitripennis]|uniref:uncharacterized protein LOC124361070 n=1 Tax=Homalodisca vitripennis TaxID=197043 RepID=UPI001EE9F959|nr:uncharacterized protein LOC124361070 [Homalodisca vitripennis]KAG8328471.1 hypothetical protein J6590_001143 [Homalodisca vitripennis]
MVPLGVLYLVSFASMVGATPTADPGLDGCLQTDPVSCVRDEVFRSLSSLFGEDSAEFMQNVSSELDEEAESAERRMRAMHGAGAEGAEPPGINGNQSPEPGGRPDTYDAVFEGRGKKLKKLLPLLLVLKVQYFIYGVIAYVVVALIAKAALIKSSLALVLAGLFLLRKLLSPHGPLLTRHEVKVHGSGGGAGGGHGAGWDSYASAHADHHKQYAHNMAYSSQKPVGGR